MLDSLYTPFPKLHGVWRAGGIRNELDFVSYPIKAVYFELTFHEHIIYIYIYLLKLLFGLSKADDYMSFLYKYYIKIGGKEIFLIKFIKKK